MTENAGKLVMLNNISYNCNMKKILFALNTVGKPTDSSVL